MHKALLIEPQKCTSCMQCELACSFEHTGAFNPVRPLTNQDLRVRARRALHPLHL